MPKMSAEEIESLVSSYGILRLATISVDGSPSLNPLAYVYQDRRLMLTARERSAWLGDIRRDPRVCVSIDQPEYPLKKVTIRARAEIVYEPGQDDEWRELRVPQRNAAWTGPVTNPDGTEEWNLYEAYSVMTENEPRALVAVPLEGAKVTSWRMAGLGEYVDEFWPKSYYSGDSPRRFKVSALDEVDLTVTSTHASLGGYRAIAEPTS